MNRTVTSFFALALAGAFSFIGCGDDTNNNPTGSGGNGGSGGGGAIAIDEIGTKTAELYCGLIYSCCTTAEQAEAFDGLNPKPTNEAECRQTFKGFFDGLVLPGLKEVIAAGRLEYDGDLAASCLPQLEGNCAAVIGDPFENNAECDMVFMGKVADGSDCSGDDECSGADSVCVGETDMALGKCQARGGAGAACDFEGDCTTNYCDFATSMCAEQKALGAACSGFNQCKDSYCDFNSSVCTAKKADGQACMGSDECESDDCDMTTNTCVSSAPICDGM